jgi:hypothetical protein
MSYDASGHGGDRQLLLLPEVMRNAVFQEGLSQRASHVAVPPCTSAIRALLAFSIAHRPRHNLLAKCECCHFAQVIGITSDPRTTFPLLLKVRASTLGLCALLAGSDRRRLHCLDCPLDFVASRSIGGQRQLPDQTVLEPAAPSAPH